MKILRFLLILASLAILIPAVSYAKSDPCKNGGCTCFTSGAFPFKVCPDGEDCGKEVHSFESQVYYNTEGQKFNLQARKHDVSGDWVNIGSVIGKSTNQEVGVTGHMISVSSSVSKFAVCYEN